MGAEIFDSDKLKTKMFAGVSGISCDEELALHIFHRFNIDRDTMECMPAFDEHIEPMFAKKIEK